MEMEKKKHLLLEKGQIIKDRYKINSVFTMQEDYIIYQAIDMNLDLLVILKERILDHQDEDFQEKKDRYLFEARTLMKLDHSNIIKCLNYIEIENRSFIVMEYIKGKKLKDLLNDSFKLSVNKTKKIALQIMDALEYIHLQGYVYLNVSLESIVVNEKEEVKLIDFSSITIRHTKLNEKTQKNRKSQYLPLELINGNKYAEKESDIYSLGVTLYELLSGITPFMADKREQLTMKYHKEIVEKLTSLDEQIPPCIDAVISKSMAIKKENRYVDIKQFRKAFLNEKEEIKQEKELNYQKRRIYVLIAISCIMMVAFVIGIYYQKNKGLHNIKVTSETIDVYLPYKNKEEKEINQEMINAFEKEYPKIKVNLTQESEEKYITGLKESSLPNVFINNQGKYNKHSITMKELMKDLKTNEYIGFEQNHFDKKIPLNWDASIIYVNRILVKNHKITLKKLKKEKFASNGKFIESSYKLQDFINKKVNYYCGSVHDMEKLSKEMPGYWDILETDKTLYEYHNFISVKNTTENKENASMLLVYELLGDYYQNSQSLQLQKYLPVNKETMDQFLEVYPKLKFLTKEDQLESEG